MESGVATRPLEDLEAYADSLDRFVFRSGFIMKPLFSPGEGRRRSASSTPRARTSGCCAPTQVIVEEGIAKPILIGRPSVVEARLKRFGLSIEAGRDFELVNPEDDPRYRDYVATYVEAAGRKGITPDAAKTLVRTNTTVIGALAVRRGRRGRADLRSGGPVPVARCKHIKDIIGLAPGTREWRPCRSSSRRRAPTSSPTRMCSPIRPPRRSPI